MFGRCVISVWRCLTIGLVALLILVACTGVPDPAPTPRQNVAEVATMVVERPSVTSFPTLTPTPQLRATPIPTATDEMVTVTAVTIFTRIPSPTPDPYLSVISQSELNELLHPISEYQGRRPFVQDGVLLRQMGESLDEFEGLGYLQTAVWSPDGSKLLYNLTNKPDTFDDPASEYEQWLWSVEDGTFVSLADLVANYPDPAYHIFEIFWSPDSTKILLWAGLDERHEEAASISYDSLLVVIDLDRQTTSDILFVSNDRPVWLTNNVFVIRDHCGSPCAFYRAYNYSNELAWEFDWRTGGFVDFAAEGNFMINVGRGQPDAKRDDPQPPPTVDEIDLTTGELKIIWESLPEEGYFNPFFMPELSSDEQYIAFNYGYPYTVYVIDRNGQEYWQYANSHVVDWRPNNELTVCQMLDSGSNQLVHLNLAGESQIIFSTEAGTDISQCSWDMNGNGKWSPDGRFFIFTTENETKLTEKLYLWMPENDEIRLIHSIFGNSNFNSFDWLPDSTGFYFSRQQDNTIWFYQVETAD